MQGKQLVENTMNKVYYARLNKDKLIQEIENNKKVFMVSKCKKVKSLEPLVNRHHKSVGELLKGKL